MYCRNCKKINQQSNQFKKSMHNSVFPEKITNKLKEYSLDLFKCNSCELVQFYKTPPLQDMYGLTYGYRTSLSPLMIKYIKKI